MPSRSRTSVLSGGRRAQVIRAELRPLVEAGEAVCPFCRRLIVPGQSWDVDHGIPLDIAGKAGLWDRSMLRPAHSRCNRKAGQRISAAKRRGKPQRRPRVQLVPCRGCGDRVIPQTCGCAQRARPWWPERD